MQTHLSLQARTNPPRRGGAVIIVVLALLSLMIFLGVFFFEFAQEEQMAAGNYANNQYSQLVEPDAAFAEAKKQLIFGADTNHTMSPLYSGDGFTLSAPSGMPPYGTAGSHTSLLSKVLGRNQVFPAGHATVNDLLPHNGPGIATSWVDVNGDGYCGPNDHVRFDMDGDGAPDAVLDPSTDPLATGPSGLPGFGINFSRAAQIDSSVDAFAQPTTVATQYGALRPFRPDVDYTYPDINNIHLAYEAIVGDRRVFVPSFHRPDLLKSYRQSGFDTVYTDVNTRRLVMRPHAEHRYPDGTRRFVTQGVQALSGDRSRFIGPFPFQVDTDNDGRYNEQGYYSVDPNTGLSENYELDVDVNGDGEPDGIWMDIGMDIVTLSDGRQFVPLVSYLVLDADSLINLNVHGNLDGLRVNGQDFLSGPVSVSNTGASPSEVNPLRALVADPARIRTRTDLIQAQTEHYWNFLNYPSFTGPATIQYTTATAIPANNSLLPMANMEWMFLTAGREKTRYITQSAGAPILAKEASLTGRYGDVGFVAQLPNGAAASAAAIPAPGVKGTDDDLDENPDSQQRYSGGSHVSTYQLNDPHSGSTSSVHIPQATHPIAPRGTGRNVHRNDVPVADPRYGLRRNAAAVPGSPVIWPEYPSGWEAPNGSAMPALKVVETPYPYGGAVFSAGTSSVTDEDDETNLATATSDDLFDASENLRLHSATADYARLNEVSRLDELAPLNFLYARTAEKIRRNFSTHSFDLNELSYIPRVSYDAVNSTYSRPEVGVWNSTSLSGRQLFPPDFNPTGMVVDSTLMQFDDPIRPELRLLLASQDTDYAGGAGVNRRETLAFDWLVNGTSRAVSIWRQPLNLNRLLVGFDTTGEPIYRHLMPHPDMAATGITGGVTIAPMLHDHNPTLIPYPLGNINGTANTANVQAMEWWARYDRQRLARDIYTLLYLVGAPTDMNPTLGGIQSPLNTTYPAEVTREMAQFAVNYVDSLDRDDVITKFEYDDDLHDGWSSTPAKFVYGVERASLTFSEVQFVQVDEDTTNKTTTYHKEENNKIHQYLHIELRNVSPFNVDLERNWRLSRVMRGTGTRDRSVYFHPSTTTNSVIQIGPGSNFLIATHDGTVETGGGAAANSDIYADYTGGSELESILPSSNNTLVNDTVAVPDPQADLDLCVSGLPAADPHSNYFSIPATGDAGSAYGATNTKLVEVPTSIAHVEFDLVLERRQNPYGITDATDEPPAGTDARGEWIEVDRFHVDSSRMGNGEANLTVSTDDQAGVVGGFDLLNSVERRQAFDPVQIQHINGTGAVINHTMAKLNGGGTSHVANAALGGTEFTLWEPHFDRDLTSKYELLSVPLYGNWPLAQTKLGTTNTGADAADTFYPEIQGGTQFNLAPGGTIGTSGRMSGDFTAGVRFKFPNGIPGKPYRGWNKFNYQNAWYRLFDFVTTPRRADQVNEDLVNGEGGAEPQFRVPGKINLNTIRDDAILAALLDDEVHLAYGTGTVDQITTNRDFYREMLQSRDGEDYFTTAAGVPGLPLPNSIISRPFRNSGNDRDLNWSSTLDDRGVENGLLRSAPRRDPANLAANPALGYRPAGTAYAKPALTSPADFGNGLWGGGATFDTTSETWQGLFDAGDPNNQLLDHHTRDRILAKIANNSTTRSHVYLVWTAVGYFEAHNVVTAAYPGGVPQIGSRMTDLPVHRNFMVIDMSPVETNYTQSNGRFENHENFILYEKRLR